MEPTNCLQGNGLRTLIQFNFDKAALAAFVFSALYNYKIYKLTNKGN